MAAGEEVEVFPVDPLLRNTVGMVGPSERPTWFWLARAVDCQRIVCRSTAKLIAVWAVADILKRAAVDQHRAIHVADTYAERIGMAVSAAARAKRPRVNDDLALKVVHDVQARIGESNGLIFEWTLAKLVECVNTFGTNQP